MKPRPSFIYGIYEGYLVGCVCALIAGVIYLANMVGNLRHDVRALEAKPTTLQKEALLGKANFADLRKLEAKVTALESWRAEQERLWGKTGGEAARLPGVAP